MLGVKSQDVHVYKIDKLRVSEKLSLIQAFLGNVPDTAWCVLSVGSWHVRSREDLISL